MLTNILSLVTDLLDHFLELANFANHQVSTVAQEIPLQGK